MAIKSGQVLVKLWCIRSGGPKGRGIHGAPDFTRYRRVGQLGGMGSESWDRPFVPEVKLVTVDQLRKLEETCNVKICCGNKPDICSRQFVVP